MSSILVTRMALVFALAYVPSALNSQSVSTVLQEPQYVGQFAQIGPEGKLIPLEQVKPTLETSAKNHFVTNSVNSSYVVPNASSPIRVSPTARFVVKASPSIEGMDPNTLVNLKAFVVQKDKRTFPIASTHGVIFGGVKSGSASEVTIPITFKKYGTSSLEVVPAQPLSPGEYAFGGTGLPSNFCFGVDAK